MGIDVSPSRGKIQQDIELILRYDNPYKNNVAYEINIHTENSTIPLSFVESVEYMRNYGKYISDFVVLKFKISLGAYSKVIYTQRDNLMCSIKKIFKDKVDSDFTTMYKMVILKDGGKMESDQTIKKLTADELDKAGMVAIEAQLYLREVEGFRSSFIDGIYKNVILKDVIIGLLAQAKNNIQVDGLPLEYNIDVYEPNNTQQYENLIIPTGITLDNLPNYLQGTDYGVYNGDIGMYIQPYNKKTTVFVYPLFNTERFNKETGYKLTFINPNTAMYDVVENNWYIDGNNIKIICNSQVKIIDNGVRSYINSGDGIVSISASNLFEQNYEITDDGILLDKDSTLEGSKIVDRRDKISKTRYIGPQSNMYKYRSELLNTSMATYQITWNFSAPDYLYPGMPVEYVYEENGVIIRLPGILQCVYSLYQKVKGTQTSVVIIKVLSYNVYISQPSS